VAEAPDPAARPVEPRRRTPVWLAVALALALLAVVALGGWAIASVLDDEDDAEAQWEACAERVDPPAARSDRLREFREDEDVEAARDRLAEEIRRVERRIEGECGVRP
jgi:type VI protein secretion system component VasF